MTPGNSGGPRFGNRGGRDGVTARLQKIPVSLMTPDQRALYDAIAGGPRAAGPQVFALVDSDGQLEGPFNAMLLSPQLGDALQALGSAVRYQTALSSRARELAILAVAYAWASDFECYAHEAIGRAAGLTEDDLAAVRGTRFGELADPFERTVAATAHVLVSRGDLDDAEYASAREILGERVLFELSTLVGYYMTLAMQLRLFRVTAPRGGERQSSGGSDDHAS
jgi:4-carboxymuconolactone decarboxylase